MTGPSCIVRYYTKHYIYNIIYILFIYYLYYLYAIYFIYIYILLILFILYSTFIYYIYILFEMEVMEKVSYKVVGRRGEAIWPQKFSMTNPELDAPCTKQFIRICHELP